MKEVEKALRLESSPRDLAQAFLRDYLKGKQVLYPLNPFQMLTDLGVPFVFRPFSNRKLEGMYLPAQAEDDIATVGINIKRPVTRQRYTAAHELCHHLKDSKNGRLCPVGSQDPVESYAEKFAAELLMPYAEMNRQIQLRAPRGMLSMDDVLEIAEYFGVSFLSCLLRAAWIYRKIGGDNKYKALLKQVESYKPNSKRAERGYTDIYLYEQLIDADEPWLKNTVPQDIIKAKYCNNYIFNDSRLENVGVDSFKVAEIVSDIRRHGTESIYCTEDHETEIAIAGHAFMYEQLFAFSPEDEVSLSSLLRLHQALFSCAPSSEFGGKLRNANPIVKDARFFETLDFHEVAPAMGALFPTVQDISKHRYDIPLSKYIEAISRLHHRLTVIHPFGDGNGRSTRGFLNLLLVHRGLFPIYIRVQEKDQYYKALAIADRDGDFDELYAVIFRSLLRAQAELTEFPAIG